MDSSGETADLDLLDAITEAALRPQHWDTVLQRLAAETGCVAGGLTVEDAQTRTGTPICHFDFDQGHVERCFDLYLPINPLY